MKKLIYCALALAAGLFATSCQQENLEPVAQENTVTFTVETPAALQTKAIADGMNVDKLIYEVWLTPTLGDLTTSAQKLYQETQGMRHDNGVNKTVITLDLVNDQKYTVLLWAQVDGTGVYNTTELNDVHYNSTEAGAYAANDERLAAFYGVAYVNDGNPVNKDGSKAPARVELRRPFAQVNLGTLNTSTEQGSTTGYTIDIKESNMILRNVPTHFNVVNGMATKPAEMGFLMYNAPCKDLTSADAKLPGFTNPEYYYAGMNYVFASNEETGITAELEYNIKAKLNGGSEVVVNNTIPNVPLKENYRTNIIGNLLTSSAKYEVVIDANWVADYNGNEDGEFAPAYNEETKTYEIATAQELAWVSEQSKAGNNFKGKTLVVMNDIDLNGANWTPIADFHGTFKGVASTKAATYPTISNFTVNVAECAGLFGDITGGKLSDFNVRNATITANHYAGAVVGFMHGSGSITNVHVQNSTISVTPILNASNKYDDGDKAGAIAGYFCADGTNATMRMENCSATGVDILAYRDLGGLVGCLNGNAAYVGSCQVTNVTVTADTDYDYKSNSAINAGEVVGRLEGEPTVGNNTVTDVTVEVIEPLSVRVQTENAVINLLPNKTYTMPSNIANGVSIIGAEGTIINTAGVSVKADNFTIQNVTLQSDKKKSYVLAVTGKNPKVEGVVFKGAAGNGTGLVVIGKDEDDTITVKDCDFSQDDFFKPIHDNSSGLGGATLLIEGCKIANGLYVMHIDGNLEAGRIVVKDSYLAGFITNGASLDYVSFENCEFGVAAGYACVNVYTAHSFLNCTFPTKADANNTSNYGLYVTNKAKGDQLTIKNCKMSDDTALTVANIDVANGGFLHWDSDAAACLVSINDESIVTTIPEEGISLSNSSRTVLMPATVDKAVVVSGEGVLAISNANLTKGVVLAENAKVTIEVLGENTVTGDANGILIPESAKLTVTGEGSLNVVGNNGSGIGYASTSEKTNTAGKITISNLASLTAKGTGDHAYGIGGIGANVVIESSTVDYACGGHIQPLFNNDMKYGKSEPEGGAAIGGATVKIEGSTITKVDGGSKAAAIGAEFWQSTSIEIVNSTIVEANGGNASAGIGGSRYSNYISAENKQSCVIYIENSTVKAAIGGQFGAGIGSGYDTHCAANSTNAVNNITIKNSTITAQGGKYAAGIGTGFHAAALTGSIDAASTINATSGESFYKDTYTTAQNIGYGVVDPAREFKDQVVEFTVAGNVIAHPWPSVTVGGASYGTFEEAMAAAKAGDVVTLLDNVTLSQELTLPAGITLNGNGKQIEGTINAGGNLTFVGHTKVTAFSASYYNRVITISEGACLEVTGGDRVSLAYGNTFNITGSIENAKTADKANIQPSLIIPAGISITGGNDATMNVTNAYVQIGSTTSKNSAANGVFTLNFTNAIAEFTNQLTFAEPTSGKTPTFNLNITNSVLTTGTKLIAAAPDCNIKVDNSTVDIATYFRNSGNCELINGSSLTGSTIQFGENGGHDGKTTVDGSTFTINTGAGHPYDGKGVGEIIIKNNSTATVTYYTGIKISVDNTSSFIGELK